MSMTMAFRLFIDKTFFLEDTCCSKSLIQYIFTIMHYDLVYNIVNVVNRPSFIYKGLAPKL